MLFPPAEKGFWTQRTWPPALKTRFVNVALAVRA
jgi:hypothetical protein